jgi:hypothetical protein
MMLQETPQIEIGEVGVTTTHWAGHDVDYWAEQTTNKIVSIGGNCHPIIAQLEKQGQPEMADILRRL